MGKYIYNLGATMSKNKTIKKYPKCVLSKIVWLI